MKDVIFEALVTEAQFRVVEHTTKGVAIDEAIAEVAREMELEEAEVAELSTRAKKAPMPKPVVEDEEEDSVEVDEVSSVPHQITFSDSEELEAAIGVLMYKGIAWLERGSNYVSFEDGADVAKAHDALKRRWDFVNVESRTVATIEFDNLADYNKVLDFIATKNMTVILDDGEELSEDLDLKLEADTAAHKKASKDAKEQGLAAPEKPTQDLSYRALHKDKLVDTKALDPVADGSARAIRVVKRWK